MLLHQHFNPLPPHGGRHDGGERLSTLFTFQSTPSAWRETCPSTRLYISSVIISIHSLRMEGDTLHWKCPLLSCYFNPLPPHGGRHLVTVPIVGAIDFNPLPPHGGRPSVFCICFMNALYFNPLPPHGGRPGFFTPVCYPRSISIHSLRMEGDPWSLL